ncbi:hypothetical protein FXB38_22485 [Bradyrhizobium cytisi]|uniref:Uncharacterized protein n=1 Tax=Bradyrhizobium cytisi TaxID=515489 RepID=A0A5S4WI32_9BRAD|nr:hypothetical protein FXB38_22485 [Bradyrhizobium cytisi]
MSRNQGNKSATSSRIGVPSAPSLRAQRSNPESLRGKRLDCFAALAMTECRREHRSYPTRSTRCARDGDGSNRSPKYCVSCATDPSRNSMMLTT